ncbi:coiled-coil domain-containing protein 112-like [Sitodiplosis mosellana]|uniref:coiled-coil domain-containing protein 112-like n=1 Tax=Sitodiplosis mosellana TaxID=263140 RepID=UPI002444BEC2|nr:coiled-coil domain-containing protein 112-like [Sitodiplosis mosellana]
MQRTDKKPNATHLLIELTKLKTQQKYLEATQASLKPVSHTPSEASELNDLEYLKIEQDLNTSALTDKLKHDAFRLHDMVNDFRCEMLNVASLCKFNTKQYRERIEVIDQQQRELDAKNLDQLKQLKMEYCNIESELLPLMSNLDLLEKMPTIKNKISTLNMRRVQSAPIDKTDSDDVRRFDRYLKEHNGHTGGWIQEEHLLFVKLKNKHNNSIEQICAAFQAFLVDKNEKEIRTHNEWYEKYLELKMKKRQAVQNWKRSRTPLRTMLQTA